MTSTDHGPVTNSDHPAAANTPPADGAVSPAFRITGTLVAAWCLGFAAVNAWQLATGRLTDERFAGYTAALVVASILVLFLKLVGAGMALASLRTVHHRGVRWLLGAALWAATSTLALYSAGNLVFTLGTVTGLLAPTAAWEAAGGVTVRAVGYGLFFLAGAAMSAVLTVSYHRRHRLRWPAVVAGFIGPPVLLGGLLVVIPALLGTIGS
jgi:hypothetical protein